MNKGQFVDAVYDNLTAQGFQPISKAQTERNVNAVLNVLRKQMAEGQRVQFSGFGTFYTYVKKERNGHNPRTGEPLLIPKTRTVKFSPGLVLKRTVLSDEQCK